jgi:hypothetical protein
MSPAACPATIFMPAWQPAPLNHGISYQRTVRIKSRLWENPKPDQFLEQQFRSVYYLSRKNSAGHDASWSLDPLFQPLLQMPMFRTERISDDKQ